MRERRWLVWATCVAFGLLAPELMAQDTLIVNLSLKTSDFSFGNQYG
ncbi:MAG: hypothetical protein ABIM74_05930 [candidate division WOR-3 bacterium]